jgi:hypothetical protein
MQYANQTNSLRQKHIRAIILLRWQMILSGANRDEVFDTHRCTFATNYSRFCRSTSRCASAKARGSISRPCRS